MIDHTRRLRTVLAIALAGIDAGAFAWTFPQAVDDKQTIAAQPAPSSFRTGVDLVALNVSVTGRDGRHIDGLSSGDFRVLDNNRPQRLSFVLPGGRVPLAVVLLIDCSASMRDPKLARAKQAATAFLGALRSDDLVELIAFNESTDRPAALSGDHAAAERAVGGMAARGQTALYDAMHVATDDLRRARRHLAPEYRLAIVLLSDGDDNASRLSFEDVLDETRRSDVIVYPVSLRLDDKRRWMTAPFDLSELAFQSGGRALAVRDGDALPEIYQEIRSEIESLYLVGYVPDRPTLDGTWHTVRVQVSDSGAVVRTRTGYYATAPLAGSLGSEPSASYRNRNGG